MTRLPDFVVLGQGKAGTSLIYRVFEQNPQVGLSETKELLYFSDDNRKSFEWYTGNFAHVAPDVPRMGEISPSYLQTRAIEGIHQTLGPEVQLIYVLRHPIDWAYSRYLQNICAARGDEAKFIPKAYYLNRRIKKVEDGLRALYAHYPKEQILPLMYELDIATDTPQFEHKICDFLGLPRTNNMDQFLRKDKVNAGVMPRFVYGGKAGLDFVAEGRTYHIPAGTMVFCAQPRNTEIYPNASPAQVAQAATWEARWTKEIDVTGFMTLQEEVVVPYAERLEDLYGLNLDHWRVGPRAIRYAPATPPETFLVDPQA